MKKNIVIAFIFVYLVTNAFGQTVDEWLEKANEYFKKGDYTNAINAYSKVIEYDDIDEFDDVYDINAYWFRGISYFNLRNYNAAVSDFQTVTAFESDFPDAYVYLGDAYGHLGRYNFAVWYFSRGLAKNFDFTRYHVNKNNNSDMWFCGTIYMEILLNRFLANSEITDKYENILRIVCEKNNLTRADVESFYINNINKVISDEVDKRFNNTKITILSIKGNYYSGIRISLTRNPQNGYLNLKYEKGLGPEGELSASSLELLITNMQRNSDFTEFAISEFRIEIEKIPTLFLNSIDVQNIKSEISGFMASPNGNTILPLHRKSNNISTQKDRAIKGLMESVVSYYNYYLVQKIRKN